MLNLPWRPSAGVPPVGDCALDELLATGQPPQDAASGLLPVAEVLAALRAGPSGSELAGKARALAHVRDAARVPHRSRRVLPLRPGVLRRRVSAKLVTATATAAVVAGGAAAAYAGALPAPLQNVVHRAIAAPAPSTGTAGAPGAGGPAAAGAAAYGLCIAYRNAIEHGNAAQKAVILGNLVKAVGRANVNSACASALHRRAPHSRPGAVAEHHRVPWTAHPGAKRPAHPVGQRHADPGGDRHGRLPVELPRPPVGKWPGPPGGDWPGPAPGKWPAPVWSKLPSSPAGNQSGLPAQQRPAGPPGQLLPRHQHHDPSPREARCGSAPGAQQPSQVHPSALSGRGHGC